MTEENKNLNISKDTSKDLVAVKCPNCQTVFYKEESEVGKKETCPVCRVEVVFNIQKNGQNIDTADSSG